MQKNIILFFEDVLQKMTIFLSAFLCKMTNGQTSLQMLRQQSIKLQEFHLYNQNNGIPSASTTCHDIKWKIVWLDVPSTSWQPLSHDMVSVRIGGSQEQVVLSSVLMEIQSHIRVRRDLNNIVAYAVVQTEVLT